MSTIMNMAAFSIPISYTSLGDPSRELNKLLVADALYETELNHASARSGVNVIQTMFGMETKYTSFEQLTHLIKQFVEPYLKWVGVTSTFVEIHDLWANVNTSPYAYHMPHSHSTRNNDIFTGVYFPTSGFQDGVAVSEKQDISSPVVSSKTMPGPGDLVFLDPLENIKTSIATTTTQKYPFFGNPICIEPREGTIVLFPSYLSHLVTPTKKENFTRISIAYNVRVSA